MGDLLAFVGVAVVVIVTPGPDTALTVRNTLLGGRPAGIWTAFGVSSGQAVPSLLPQFATDFSTVMALGLLFAAMTFAWLVAYVFAVGRARAVLRRPAVQRVTEAVTGTVLVALGLRLATESRR